MVQDYCYIISSSSLLNVKVMSCPIKTIYIFTDCIQCTREGEILYLGTSVHSEGVPLSSLMGVTHPLFMGIPHAVRRGYPIQSNRGTPPSVTGGYPIQSDGGTPSSLGTPSRTERGTPPSLDGTGTPTNSNWMGVPPPPTWDWIRVSTLAGTETGKVYLPHLSGNS